MKFTLTIHHVGPDRYTWVLSTPEADGHVTDLNRGMAKDRDQAEREARAWATWHVEDTQGDTETIEFEL